MSQHDYAIADAAGAAFLADLNLALAAAVSNNSGATAPSTTYPYMLWADTTSGWLKQRNAADSAWIKRWPLGTAARTDVASAATLDLTANAVNSDYLRITGTTTVTAVTLEDGQRRVALAGGAFKLTNGASLVVEGGADYTCTAGDLITFIGEASSVVRAFIKKGDGTSITSSGATQLQSISASVNANALTLTYNGGKLDFRSATLTTGTPNSLTVASNSITVPSGATLGTVNATAARLVLLEYYNAGTPVAGVINLAGGNQLDETNLVSPTTIGGASNSANVFYSASSVSANSPYRVVGFIDITEATAGTWATAPTQVQGVGGQALAALSSLGYGQAWASYGGRISGTTYYNTTGKPIAVSVNASTYSAITYTVNGVSLSTAGCVTFIVPPGQSYSATLTINNWNELR